MTSAGKLHGEVHAAAGRFLSRHRSDLYNNTPNLKIDILRDQAQAVRRLGDAHPDAAAQRVFAELCLPDQEADDQYQVILEVEDQAREQPGGPGELYIKSDDGQRLVPLNALATWKHDARPAVGQPPQPVHQRDVVLQPEPGVPIGDATDYIEKPPRRRCPADVRGEPAGRGADVPADTVTQPDHPDGRWPCS